MPERLTFCHFDSFLLLQVYELLILWVIAGVGVVNNTSCVAAHWFASVRNSRLRHFAAGGRDNNSRLVQSQ
jgi:hypothetical protein